MRIRTFVALTVFLGFSDTATALLQSIDQKASPLISLMIGATGTDKS